MEGSCGEGERGGGSGGEEEHKDDKQEEGRRTSIRITRCEGRGGRE